MLRMPNPGADIDSFLRIYQELFEALRERVTFDLDDMTKVLIERNLATSSGYMGEEALRRSFNRDRSRDPLYNQAKMYSELYKVLGWLHPTPESALIFRFTYLGAHVVAARRDSAAIFKESILGMAYPNAILSVKGNQILRPFATVLRTMAALDGLLSRDEMIVGPLSLEDDRNQSQFDAMTTELKSIRKGQTNLNARLGAISHERNIKLTTMGNYTRFPLAVMKWTGWASSERRREYYGQSIPFLVLTDDGRQATEHIESCLDIRAADIEALDEQAKASVIRVAFYQMLERAGFEVESVRNLFSDDLAQIISLYGSARPLMFSPCQELEPEYVDPMFPRVSGTKVEESSKLDPLDTQAIMPQLVSEVSLSTSANSNGVQTDTELVSLFADAAEQAANDLGQIAEHLAEQCREFNQEEFYPFVARLFSALGYRCKLSRRGGNYQRYDAMIVDADQSIPIEIKSPGEEEHLSVKAVRQALENKIVLLSRKSCPTQRDTTSLVVGYNLPNDRSEVASLVADIYEAFGLIIGVIDIQSLLRLVAAEVLQRKHHIPEELRTLHGIIRVRDA